jgi:hypothetical protein
MNARHLIFRWRRLLDNEAAFSPTCRPTQVERVTGMDPAVVAALITAGVAVVAALASAYLAVWGTIRQHAVDLVVAALSHMGGGTQERSAGVAALMAMRGPIDREPSRVDRGGWTIYGPAIGQQLYRQLIYVLNLGRGNDAAHEIENIIAMTDWLLGDKARLGFTDPGQMHRLAVSIKAYKGNREAPAREPQDTSLGQLLSRVNDWLRDLGE